MTTHKSAPLTEEAGRSNFQGPTLAQARETGR
jgi:hypothetical protein